MKKTQTASGGSTVGSLAADFSKKVAQSMASSAATATAKTVLGKDNFNFLSGALNNVMTDPFEFLKKSWAGINSLPKSVTPTFDIEELDKRITDMKAVENWLQLNLSMLQGTIKTMEIQRGTLATLKDLGQSLTPQTATVLAKDLAGGIQQAAAAQNAAAWWELLQNQFNQVTQAAAATLKPVSDTMVKTAGGVASSVAKGVVKRVVKNSTGTKPKARPTKTGSTKSRARSKASA
jgi:hypothetical protein